MARAPAALALLILLALAPAALAQRPDSSVAFRTVAKGDGSASSVERREAMTIRSERRWRRLWSRIGTGRRPKVNFSRHMLIAVTQGRKPSGGHAIEVAHIARVGRNWRVTAIETEPGRDCFTTGQLTSPYHVVRVRRSTARVTFERQRTQKSCGD
jgi:hypothetical protein